MKVQAEKYCRVAALCVPITRWELKMNGMTPIMQPLTPYRRCKSAGGANIQVPVSNQRDMVRVGQPPRPLTWSLCLLGITGNNWKVLS